MCLVATAILSIVPIQANPLQLPIGRKGSVIVEVGRIVDTRSGRLAGAEDIAAAADGNRWLYLGESHTNRQHHELQASVIEALVRRGRQVIVGFEMFTRSAQGSLAPWTLGWWSESEFVERSDWTRQWGFEFSLYRPVFEAIRKHRLPMAALNVPRDWVRAVGRGGPSTLTPEQRAALPELNLENKSHRSVFDALMGGHPPTGPQGANIYAAQVLWDEGMADSAIKFLEGFPATAGVVFVVLAGSGHVMYGQGINWRIERRTGESGTTVTMVEGEAPISVSRGLGDFVYVASPEK